jgi:hypothetical protein
VSYLCAGLYAEGRSDYALLLPLLDRLIPELAAEALPEVPDFAQSVGIDAPGRAPRRRDERIAAAVREWHWNPCNLIIVHADGAGDPERALRESVEPGLRLARSERPDLAAAACIPVREIEAWLLADVLPFRKLLSETALWSLPGDPEAVFDPKRAFRELLNASGGAPLDGSELYDFFGANIDPQALRRLPAFARFEAQLVTAICSAARQAPPA